MEGFDIEFDMGGEESLEISPEMRELFTPIAVQLATQVQMTDEQKMAAVERDQKMKSDPEFLSQVMEIAQKTFDEADVNNLGILNEDEFINFVGMMRANAEERSDFVPEYSNEQMQAMYAAVNRLDQSADGLALDDIVTARFIVNSLLGELALAAAAG